MYKISSQYMQKNKNFHAQLRQAIIFLGGSGGYLGGGGLDCGQYQILTDPAIAHL